MVRYHTSEEALDLSEDIVAVRVRPAAVAAREFVPVKAISQHLVRARGLGEGDGGLSLEGFGFRVSGLGLRVVGFRGCVGFAVYLCAGASLASPLAAVSKPMHLFGFRVEGTEM